METQRKTEQGESNRRSSTAEQVQPRRECGPGISHASAEERHRREGAAEEKNEKEGVAQRKCYSFPSFSRKDDLKTSHIYPVTTLSKFSINS